MTAGYWPGLLANTVALRLCPGQRSKCCQPPKWVGGSVTPTVWHAAQVHGLPGLGSAEALGPCHGPWELMGVGEGLEVLDSPEQEGSAHCPRFCKADSASCLRSPAHRALVCG